MKRILAPSLLLVCLLAALFASAQAGSAPLPRPPVGFFGIAPQTPLTAEEVAYMKAGGIESIRWPLSWGAVQPTKNGGFDWSSFDQTVEIAAAGGVGILPVIQSPPRWIAAKETTMPINSGRQQTAW